MAFLSFLGINSRDNKETKTEKFLSFLTSTARAVTNPAGTVLNQPVVSDFVKDQAVSAGRSIARSAIAPGIDLGGKVASKLTGKPYQPSIDLSTRKDPFSRTVTTLLGKEPLTDVAGVGRETLKSFGASEDTQQKYGGALGVPLVAADLFTGGKEGVAKEGALQVAKKAARSGEIVEEAANTTSRLVKQLTRFDETLRPSEKLGETLTRTNSARANTRHFDWLNHLKDTQGVAARYFGKTGSDVVYKLSQGAKQLADWQEALTPAVDRSQKLLKKVAKSSAGKADVQRRIFQALEDRPNAANYLKTSDEQELYGIVESVFDAAKTELQKRGVGTLENYAPRAAVQDALEAPDRLLNTIQASFRSKPDSGFLKKRSDAINLEDVDTKVVDMLPSYISSVGKQLAFDEPLAFFRDNIGKVNPAYLTDGKKLREGEQYLRTLFTQVLNPKAVTGYERAANRALQTTYKNQLSFNPRFIAQNLTQRFATGTQVKGGARGVVKSLSKEERAAIREGLASGDTNFFAETAEGVEGIAKKPGRFSLAQKSERGNITSAFESGVGEYVRGTDEFKALKKQGLSTADAVRQVMSNPEHSDLAIRRGNVVTNVTQFGANIVNKPEFFRESGLIAFIPKSFLKQYQRFSAGMTENLSTVLNSKYARELDILRRGNPIETRLVDFKRSAEALGNATEDVVKGIKRGEIRGVDIKDAQLYQKQLKTAINQLDKEIKGASNIRSGKTLRSFAKMWGAATAIQFLYSGGDPDKAALYGAPVNVPTRENIPGLSLQPASLPTASDISGTFAGDERAQQRLARKAANFVPGLGLVVNRGRDISRFARTLAGED